MAQDSISSMTDRRSAAVVVSGFVSAILLALLTVVPAPYAVGGPGPTFDTLSTEDGLRLVNIDGAEVFDTTGELRLTTVSVYRASDRKFTVGAVIRAWMSGDKYVVPEELIYGTREQEEQRDQAAQADWITSQERAAYSALSFLGQDIPASVIVVGVDTDSPSYGLFEDEDQIVRLNGVDIVEYEDMSVALSGLTPGDVISITVNRGGEELTFDSSVMDGGNGRAIMGVWVDPNFDLPIDVTVAIDKVGGPSAGLMFSLAIVDMLTPEDELAGQRVAGTGTIDLDGTVGGIGGIELKMIGARKAGAEYFLAPQVNCSEVSGHIPSGLNVVSVETLDDAYSAVVAIGKGQTESLPTC